MSNNRTRVSAAMLAIAQDWPTEDVVVPEWGGVVRLRGMTAGERAEFLRETRPKSESGESETDIGVIFAVRGHQQRLLARTLIDEHGVRLFPPGDTEAEGVRILGDRSAQVIDRLFQIAARLSGMLPGQAEEARKELERTSGGDTVSTSPPSSGTESTMS